MMVGFDKFHSLGLKLVSTPLLEPYIECILIHGMFFDISIMILKIINFIIIITGDLFNFSRKHCIDYNF